MADIRPVLLHVPPTPHPGWQDNSHSFPDTSVYLLQVLHYHQLPFGYQCASPSFRLLGEIPRALLGHSSSPWPSPHLGWLQGAEVANYLRHPSPPLLSISSPQGFWLLGCHAYRFLHLFSEVKSGPEISFDLRFLSKLVQTGHCHPSLGHGDSGSLVQNNSVSSTPSSNPCYGPTNGAPTLPSPGIWGSPPGLPTTA